MERFFQDTSPNSKNSRFIEELFVAFCRFTIHTPEKSLMASTPIFMSCRKTHSTIDPTIPTRCAFAKLKAHV